MRLARKYSAVIAVAAGAIGGAIPLGAFLIISSLLGLAILLNPALALAVILTTRPLMDIFWSLKLTIVGGIETNLQSVIGVVVPVAIIVSLLWRRWRPPQCATVAWLVAFGISTAIAAVIAPVRAVAIMDFGRTGLPLVFIFIGMYIHELGWGPMRLAFVMAAYGVVPVAMVALQLCGVIQPLEGAVSFTGRITRVTGYYHHPLDLALRCAIALPFTLMMYRRASSRVGKVCAGTWVALVAGCAYVTLVRSALAAITVQLLLWLWLQGYRKALRGMLVLAGVVVLLVSPVRLILLEGVGPILSGRYYELGTGRGMIFAAQTQAFISGTWTQRLLGRGLQTSPKMTIEYNPVPGLDLEGPKANDGTLGAHNQVLRLLVESGLLGLGSFCGFLWVTFRAAGSLRKSPDASEREFAIAICALLGSFLVFSLTSLPFDQPSVTWPIYTLLGFAVSRQLGVRTIQVPYLGANGLSK